MVFSKRFKVSNNSEVVTYCEIVDYQLMEDYGFEYKSNCFGYGPGLQRVVRQDELYYMWINLMPHKIYLYQEYECGGKTWDMEIALEEEITTIEKILDILDQHV